jgi:FtsP/CotA-like multicopper oxidase with cupredoxin domain
MPEQREAIPNRGNAMKTTIRRLRRWLAAAAATLVVAAGASSQAAAAATPSPSPSPSRATTTTPKPAAPVIPAATPKAKPKPTHATPVKPALITKSAARAAVSRNAASALLAGPDCLVGANRSFDLFANAGTGTTGPLTGVPFWGFSLSGIAPSLPGPTLIACQGDTIAVTLHNQLPVVTGNTNNLSLEIPASAAVPDAAGTPSGTNRAYTYTGLAPGTYLYEAGPTPGGARQVAMGLAGLLIVRPTGFTALTQSAYGLLAGQFTAESVLEVSEIDTAFNFNPFITDLHEYNPNLFLVNGQPYSSTGGTRIDVAPGDVLLLREANLGLRDHSLDILGHRQHVLADDSHVLTNAQDAAAKWLTSGQVADSFVTVDAGATTGFQYPIFDGGFHLNNDTTGGLGGMLAYLNVVTTVGGVPGGPATTNVHLCLAGTSCTQTNPGQLNAFDPNSGAVTVTATFTAAAGRTLQQAEWFVDNIGASGSVAATRPIPGVSGASATVTFTIAWPDYLAALAQDNPTGGVNGDHVIWVHAMDTSGAWGAAAGDVETVNVSGASVEAISLHASRTNGTNPNDIDGTNDVVVWATGISSLPDWAVLGAYACLDTTTCAVNAANRFDLFTNPFPTGPAHNGDFAPPANYPALPGVSYPAQTAACTPLPQPGPPATAPAPVNQPGGATIVSACGTIPTATLAGLTEGTHYVFVRAYEGQSFGGSPNGGAIPAGWGVRAGAAAVSTLVIDRTGPKAGGATVAPNPNNGYQNSSGNLGFLDSVLVTATLDDTASGGSNIADGEVFIMASAVPAGSPAGTRPQCDGTTPPTPAEYDTGASMVPNGSKWDAPTKTAYAYIPLSDIRACAEGKVTLWIHGKDAAGNWGSFTTAGQFTTTTLTLDQTAPLISSVTHTTAAGVTTFTVTANDPTSNGVSSNIVAAEWFAGATDPGPGNATAVPAFAAANPATITFTATVAVGTVVHIRVRDAAGNWSAVSSTTV